MDTLSDDPHESVAWEKAKRVYPAAFLGSMALGYGIGKLVEWLWSIPMAPFAFALLAVIVSMMVVTVVFAFTTGSNYD